MSSRGKGRAKSSASSSSSTLTASSSDVSIKRYVNNKDSLNNNNNNGNGIDSVSDIQPSAHHGSPGQTAATINNIATAAGFPTVSQLGLYREPRLNKSDSASLSHQLNASAGGSLGLLRGQCQGSNVPLSPNSIDNR